MLKNYRSTTENNGVEELEVMRWHVRGKVDERLTSEIPFS